MKPPPTTTTPCPPHCWQVSRPEPGSRPRAFAGGTGVVDIEIHLALRTENSLLKVDLKVETQVVAALGRVGVARLSAAAAAENVAEAAAEERAQDILQVDVLHVGEIASEIEAARPEGRC